MTYTTMIPLGGKATKADAKLINAETNGAEITFKDNNPDERIQKVKGKLSRRYVIVSYTEEQYNDRKLQKLINILTPAQLAKTQII